jgi:DNA-binding XRE family transcriptional regulator
MVTRIRQLLDNKQLTPTQFADHIGVGRPVMSHILSERNKPSLEVVQRIISAFPEISLPWLLSGTGDMLDEATAAGTTTTAILQAPEEATPPLSTAIPALSIASPTPSVLPEEPVVISSAVTPEAEQAPATRAHSGELPPVTAPAAPLAMPAPLAQAAAVLPTRVAGKPFRAPRFVPATSAAPPAVAPPRPAALLENERPAVPAAFRAPAAALPSLAAQVLAASPAATPAASGEQAEAALLPFLGEPGKAIRRIVIFYRDGSFADYQPEA